MNETTITEAKPIKRLLLRKHHDITAFTSDSPTRYVLQGVNYNGASKLLEATDGKVLIRVPVEESDEFPPVAKLDSLPETNGQCCDIPSKPLLKALKNIPKSILPILESVRLDVEASSKDSQAPTFHLTTNDLDTVSTISGRAIEGTYPNTEQVIPTEKPTLTVVLGAELLLKIAQYTSKYGAGKRKVKFQFIDEVSGVRFSIPLENGVEATGVLMPMRLS